MLGIMVTHPIQVLTTVYIVVSQSEEANNFAGITIKAGKSTIRL